MSLADNTDVETLTPALTINVARTLGVPRRCLFMTWVLPPSVTLLAPTPGTVVPITCTVMDMDEDFWTQVDTECYCCGDPCLPCEATCFPWDEERARAQNCERCLPDGVCKECSLQLADGSCCLLCLEPEDLPCLTRRQKHRAFLVRPALRAAACAGESLATAQISEPVSRC